MRQGQYILYYQLGGYPIHTFHICRHVSEQSLGMFDQFDSLV